MAKAGVSLQVYSRFNRMLEFVDTDNLQGLRAFIEDADVHSPGHWQTGEGRFTLRKTTNNAIRLARLNLFSKYVENKWCPHWLMILLHTV